MPDSGEYAAWQIRLVTLQTVPARYNCRDPHHETAMPNRFQDKHRRCRPPGLFFLPLIALATGQSAHPPSSPVAAWPVSLPCRSPSACHCAHDTIAQSDPLLRLAITAHLSRAGLTFDVSKKRYLNPIVRHFIQHGGKLSRYELCRLHRLYP